MDTNRTMPAKFIAALLRSIPLAALLTAALAVAGCGAAAEPTAPAMPAASFPTAAPASAEPADDPAVAASAESQRAGEVAPKFELPNAQGESVSLASYAGEKNVVLVFYRGFW